MSLIDAALRPLPPGPIIRIACGAVAVDVAPSAGGRIAQIVYDGSEWLAGYDENNTSMIGWGSYPMLPWPGRLREGRFVFEGRQHQLPINLGRHAIHGLGFALPWRIEAATANAVELGIDLPQDERWPFGGTARQRIQARERSLTMELSVTAGARAMPCAIGWHPWLRKPEHLEFHPDAMYPQDADGIAVLPLVDPTPPPWDDCFINHRPLLLQRGGQTLKLSANCRHWVIFDGLASSTAVEPQSGPPDAFNLEPSVLMPGETRSATFAWEWLR